MYIGLNLDEINKAIAYYIKGQFPNVAKEKEIIVAFRNSESETSDITHVEAEIIAENDS